MGSLGESKRARCTPLVALLLFGVLPPAWCASWTITPRLRVAEIYTDNVNLAPKGEEESDLVSEIAPGVTLTGEGRRLRVNLDYRLQALLYAESTERDDVFHRLQSSANAELIKERIFVDASANYTQRNLFNTGRIARDNISGDGERTDVATYRVSPYWRERFAGYADAELRYSRSGVLVDSPQVSDSDRNRVDFNARSGRRSPVLTWRLDYLYDRQDREDAPDFEEQEVEGEVRDPLLDDLRLLALAGYAESDFLSSRNIVDGSYWSIGAAWRPSRFFAVEGGVGENNEFLNVNLNPSRRTSLAVSYRNRSVGADPGDRYNGVLTYRIRRGQVGARYSERTTTIQRLLLEEQEGLPLDPLDEQPILDEQGQPAFSSVDLPTLTDEVFVQKRFELFAGFRLGKKSNLNLTLFDVRREFDETGDDEDEIGGRATWRWRLRPRTRLSSEIQLRHIDFRELSTEDEADDGIFRIGLTQDFARAIAGTLEYRFRRRDSSNEDSSFDENRVEARLNMSF